MAAQQGFWTTTHASSASDDWSTPPATYKALDTEFGFTLDVAASSTNHKAPEWYGLDHPDPARRDGLACDWTADANGGAIWMNPPYGRPIGLWMRKAVDEAAAGSTVVCLVPSRTDTSWFQDHALQVGPHVTAEVRFLRGRLKFGGQKNPAPFPSAVVVLRPTRVMVGVAR